MTARDERGAATVLTLAMAGVLLLVGAASGVVGAIVVAHRRAQAAADLAALAAATSLAGQAGQAGQVGGRGRDPCSTAAKVAGDNGAELDACRVEGRDVVVEVRVDGPRWLGQDQDLVAAARAGPATAPVP